MFEWYRQPKPKFAHQVDPTLLTRNMLPSETSYFQSDFYCGCLNFYYTPIYINVNQYDVFSFRTDTNSRINI